MTDVIVGPTESACTINATSALFGSDLPLLTSAKSAELSNKTMYPNVYRLATPGQTYVASLGHLLALANVPCVTIIYDSDAALHLYVGDAPTRWFYFDRLASRVLFCFARPSQLFPLFLFRLSFSLFPCLFVIDIREFYQLLQQQLTSRGIPVHSTYTMPPVEKRGVSDFVTLLTEARKFMSHSVILVG